MLSHEHKAKLWIIDNPEAWAFIKSLAFTVARGRHKIGAKLIIERARWEFATNAKYHDFKINNNYTSYFARRLLEEIPALRGKLELRRCA